MRTTISRLESELLDSRIDLSDCVISSEGDDTLVVTSRIGAFRRFLSILFGLPGLYLYAAFVRPPIDHVLFRVSAVVCAAVLAGFSLLFGFGVSRKAFNRRSREARWSLDILSFTRERSARLPEEGVIRVWSEWGDEDNPALWFYVDVGERKELGLCVGWKYEKALDERRDGVPHGACVANASPIFRPSADVFACAMLDTTATTMPLSRSVTSDITIPPASSPLMLPSFVRPKRTRSDAVE